MGPGFFTRLKFEEKKLVNIYNLIGPQFCGKPSFSGKKEIAIIKINANLGA